MEDFIIPASEAVAINLTRNGNCLFEPFPPTHTYAVFGDEEIIPGYKDLKINLSFRANDLRPTASIKYHSKLPPVNDDMKSLMDLEGRLGEFLPESAFTSDAQESNGSKEAWTPPGQLLHTYMSGKKKFEIWQSTLSDARAKEIVSNMRIFIPFFIEGGTLDFLDEPEWALERWKVFFLYEVGSEESSIPTYTLAGFGTSYRLWVFPFADILAATSSDSDDTPSSSFPHTNFKPDQTSLPEQISSLLLPSRERIAQFIILPPYQHQSHGSWLYTVMTTVFRKDKWVYEITVEEPNEDFDALRDFCDLAYLYECHPDFKNLALPDAIPKSELSSERKVPLDLLTPFDTLNKLRLAAKVAPRQFQRITEMHLLSTIPPRHRSTTRISKKSAAADINDRKYYFWRLLTKERIFIKNKDQLLQVDEDERVDKVEDTLTGVQLEYEERWAPFQQRMDKGLRKCVASVIGEMGGKTDTKASQTNGRKKRKVVSDDDEDESEAAAEGGAMKRPKISDDE